jgi:hypothetical protein
MYESLTTEGCLGASADLRFEFAVAGESSPKEVVVVSAAEIRARADEMGEDEAVASLFEELTAASPIPPERRFELLSSIRFALASQVAEMRVEAVASRLRAMIGAQNCHGNRESLEAFLQSNPELTYELVDLIDAKPGGAVPPFIQVLALDALVAMLVRRDSAGVAFPKHVSIEQAIGVARGQYNGVLPCLVRKVMGSLISRPASELSLSGGSGPASEGAASMPSSGASSRAITPALEELQASMDPDDLDLMVGLAFVRATK